MNNYDQQLNNLFDDDNQEIERKSSINPEDTEIQADNGAFECFIQQIKEEKNELNRKQLIDPKENEKIMQLEHDEIKIQNIIEKKRLEELRLSMRKIRVDPSQFRDFFKQYLSTYIIFLVFASRMSFEEETIARLLSKFEVDDIQKLENITRSKFIQFQDKIFTINYYLFKKIIQNKCSIRHSQKQQLTQLSLYQKLEIQNSDDAEYSYTNLEILLLFVALCKYLGFQCRITNIVDLRGLDIDKKYIIKGNPQSKKQQTKTQKSKKCHSAIDNLFEDLKQDQSKKIKVKHTDQKSTVMTENNNNQHIKQQEKKNKKNDQKDIGKQEKKKKIKLNNLSSNSNSDTESENETSSNNYIGDEIDKFKYIGRKSIQNQQNSTSTLKKKLETGKIDCEHQSNEKTTIKETSSIINFEMMLIEEMKESKINPEGGNNNQTKEKEQMKHNELPKIKNIKQKLANLLQAQEKVQDQFNSNDFKFWVEIFDLSQNKWIAVDPLDNKIYDLCAEEIKSKQVGLPVFFILTCFESQFQSKDQLDFICKNRFLLQNIFVQDTTTLYTDQWLKILAARNFYGLKDWWDKVQDEIGYFYLHYSLSQNERFCLSLIESLQLNKTRSLIPGNYSDFRHHPQYILKSQFKKYQSVFPGTKPLPFLFKEEEEIYERKYIVELHSSSKWKNFKREVKVDEKPYKIVTSQFKKDLQISLYGMWQTKQFIVKLNDDGTLPVNKYGNFSLYNHQYPKGAVHLLLPGLPKLCKMYNIEFANVEEGFDYSGYHPYPVIHGVLIKTIDVPKIVNLYEQFWIEEKERQKNLKKKNLLRSWKSLFKSLILKQQFKEKYKNI